jgi:hypothetical protein
MLMFSNKRRYVATPRHQWTDAAAAQIEFAFFGPTERMTVKSFFANLLLPLKHANIRTNVCYLSRVPQGESYRGAIVSRTNGLERLSVTRSGGAFLLESPAEPWATQNERNLPKPVPHLSVLRQGPIGSPPIEDQRENHLKEFVYPLF